MPDIFVAPFLIFVLMTYQDTIDYLFTRLPMFSRMGAAAYKKDLNNTWALCEFLGNPQSKFKSIHIAGTNGKGSVSHILAAIFHKAGYKTGLYTSPHLFDFRERIKISGDSGGLMEIPEQFVIDFTERIKPEIEKTEPSFFEITVAMAFEYFANEKVDIAIIETGLGGRLDSTNVITPELSVITNISADHTQMLGNTLAEIATEKAGIIKNGIPIVIGETNIETENVFQKTALEKNAPIFFADKTRTVADWKWDHHLLNISVTQPHQMDSKQYQLDLTGLYQTKNLLTVLEAVTQMSNQGWQIAEADLLEALQHSKKISGLKGRWEILNSRDPLVIADVAHNEAGIKELVKQIELTPHRNLHIVFGMVKDKDIDNALALLPKNATYYFTKAQIPRALDEEALQKQAARHQLRGQVYSNVNLALYATSLHAKKDDLIIICGSIFLVGEVYPQCIEAIWGGGPKASTFENIINLILHLP